jgi:hypothetical protein
MELIDVGAAGLSSNEYRRGKARDLFQSEINTLVKSSSETGVLAQWFRTENGCPRSLQHRENHDLRILVRGNPNGLEQKMGVHALCSIVKIMT